MSNGVFDNRIVSIQTLFNISVTTATSSLAYVGTRDGKLLVYEYQTGADVCPRSSRGGEMPQDPHHSHIGVV